MRVNQRLTFTSLFLKFQLDRNATQVSFSTSEQKRFPLLFFPLWQMKSHVDFCSQEHVFQFSLSELFFKFSRCPLSLLAIEIETCDFLNGLPCSLLARLNYWNTCLVRYTHSLACIGYRCTDVFWNIDWC